MDALRSQRYRKKQTYIVDSLEYIKPFTKDELHNRGILYSIQTAIEGVIDIIAMLVKDLGLIVNDDSQNIGNLIENQKWDKNIGEDLILANGLRNVIVHRYNGLEDKIVSNSVPEIKITLKKWLELIEDVLNELK